MSRVRKILILSAIGAALLVGGYAFGRYAVPPKTVVTEKVVQVEKQVVVTQVKTEVQVVRVTDTQADKHKKKVTVKEPNGTVTTIETHEDHTTSQTNTTANGSSTSNTVKERIVYQDRETVKLVLPKKPNWSLSLMPGFDFAQALGGNQSFSLLPVANVVVALSVERRLVGPIFGGLWGSTQGVGGISLRLEF